MYESDVVYQLHLNFSKSNQVLFRVDWTETFVPSENEHLSVDSSVVSRTACHSLLISQPVLDIESWLLIGI